MKIWQTWKSFTPQTKFMIGSGIIVWSIIGKVVATSVEKQMALQATEEEKKQVEKWIPTIRTVNKD